MIALVMAFYGTLLGALLGAATGTLSPDSSSDMPIGFLYSTVTGAIFGSITGFVLGLASERYDKAAAWVSVILGLGLGLLQAELLWGGQTVRRATLIDYISIGPGLLWSVLLLAFGFHCFLKTPKT